jgi:hypothetical protein
MDYKQKYLKYKQKYFNLRQLIGGSGDELPVESSSSSSSASAAAAAPAAAAAAAAPAAPAAAAAVPLATEADLAMYGYNKGFVKMRGVERACPVRTFAEHIRGIESSIRRYEAAIKSINDTMRANARIQTYDERQFITILSGIKMRKNCILDILDGTVQLTDADGLTDERNNHLRELINQLDNKFDEFVFTDKQFTIHQRNMMRNVGLLP